ncbi:hypothetical protein BDV96DRAFT_595859 [Lophiotrema nucula]|uniref:Uncharacterized protein n=1 Tax=Lophiotrema nucula TaxID=690887 RepID=A0A6A5ZN79_9PLEO|nr:hypothetical protein BDV96DRAFT_595859 [Lophiotrema nucula]
MKIAREGSDVGSSEPEAASQLRAPPRLPPRVKRFTAVPSPSVNDDIGRVERSQEEIELSLEGRVRSRSTERRHEIPEERLHLSNRHRRMRSRPVAVSGENSFDHGREERRRRPRIYVRGEESSKSMEAGSVETEGRIDVSDDEEWEIVPDDYIVLDRKSTRSLEEGPPSPRSSGILASTPAEQEDRYVEPTSKQQIPLESNVKHPKELAQKLAQTQTDRPKASTDTSAARRDNKEVNDSSVTDKASPDQSLLSEDDEIHRTPSRRTTWNEKAIKRSKPNPPSGDVVDPFGGLQSPDPMRTRPGPFFIKETDSHICTKKDCVKCMGQASEEDITKRPTCSLNLVCYSRGCSMVQIRVATSTRYENDEAFKKAQQDIPGLLTTDQMLFEALTRAYWTEMCGFWRRWFSLKTLRRLRLLSYANNDRPLPVPWDDYTMQEVLAAFNDPSEFGTDTDWTEWVFSLRQKDKRHMLEFVEGWNATRIAILGSMPCLASTLVGVIWSARGGDVQTAFTVAGFILTVATAKVYDSRDYPKEHIALGVLWYDHANRAEMFDSKSNRRPLVDVTNRYCDMLE